MCPFHEGDLFPATDGTRTVFFDGMLLPADASGRVDLDSSAMQHLLQQGRFILDPRRAASEYLPPHPLGYALRRRA